MKVLLINPLIQKCQWENDIASKWPPLGIAYIAAVLEQNNHQVKILERRLLAGIKPRTKEHLKEIDDLTIKEIEFLMEYLELDHMTVEDLELKILIKDIRLKLGTELKNKENKGESI